MQKYFENQINEIRKHTDRHIVVRPHPRNSFIIDTKKFKNISLQYPIRDRATYDDTDFDKTLICILCGNMVYNYNDVKPESYLYALLKDDNPDDSIEDMTQEWFQKLENKEFVSIRKEFSREGKLAACELAHEITKKDFILANRFLIELNKILFSK